ncbi:MAG: hypothetical protein ACREL5_07120 [Gemmatimonadales bacterium]
MSAVLQAPRRAMLTLALLPSLALAQQPPANGTEVLERMRQTYVNSWYPTLTFSQQTTMNRNGATTVQTWYESLEFFQGGAKLRIDFDKPALGNGVLYSADSEWVMRNDTLAAVRAGGNAFIPLIENVYLQPVATTARQLAPWNIDMTRMTSGTYDGRPVWIVGATSPADTTSPQFWIDAGQLVLVRMNLRIAPNRPLVDVHLDELVQTGGGWLATRVTMYSNGIAVQTEQYADWKADVKLDPGLFAPATWGTAGHWVKP